MKLNAKKNRVAPFLLSLLLVFQSCVLYNQSSLDSAVKERTKAKVVTTTGETLKFNKVVYNENGKYVGLKKSNGQVREFELDEKLIKEVKVKDKTASTIGTIALLVTVIGFVYIIIDGIGIGEISWGQTGNQ